MNNAVSLRQARRLIAPSLPHILKAVEEAMQAWNDSPPNYHAAMDASARAQIVNKFTYHYAATGGIPYLEDQLQRYWLFELVVVRVKLLDTALRASNYPTRRSREWNQRLPLPGIPFGRLNFGYRTDVTGTLLQDAFITLPSVDRRKVNDWVWQVRGPAVEAFPMRRDMFGEEVYIYENVRSA